MSQPAVDGLDGVTPGHAERLAVSGITTAPPAVSGPDGVSPGGRLEEDILGATGGGGGEGIQRWGAADRQGGTKVVPLPPPMPPDGAVLEPYVVYDMGDPRASGLSGLGQVAGDGGGLQGGGTPGRAKFRSSTQTRFADRPPRLPPPSPRPAPSS